MRFFIPIFTLLTIVWSGYAPEKVACPGGRLTREANGVSPQEAEWVEQRQKVTNENLRMFLENSRLDDFDAASFISSTEDRPISIGLAFSGGGYRAMLCGAGYFSALDNRTNGAHEKGLGGLLQSATYISGLSGGSWLLGSVVSNNFTSIQNIIDGDINIWDLSYSIFDGKASGVINFLKYYYQLVRDVFSKHSAGFQVTLTDIWGRALSYHFFGGTNYGDSLRWSGAQDMQAFRDHEMPYPIIIANARVPGTPGIDSTSPVVEISPFELGSWDPSLNSFTQTKYLGSTVDNGMPINDVCYEGFDNSGFILGTSSTLFNEIIGDSLQSLAQHETLTNASNITMNTAVNNDLNTVLNGVSKVDHAYAAYNPNPFKNATESPNKDVTSDDTLALADGGEDNQNVPVYPYVQKARNVDIIFAYDSSADTFDDWPNGASMSETYNRQFTEQGKTMSVPYMPDSKTFLTKGLTQKPVFFGCDAEGPNIGGFVNETGPAPGNTVSGTQLGEFSNGDQGKHIAPLIVYTANRKLSYDSNKSTFQLVFGYLDKLSMIRNGFEVASRNNGTEDSSWRTCVSCAIIRREQQRKGIQQSDQCKKCFEEYCYKK